MGLIKEFREFAVRGNVIDMAVGVIIGAAFGKIVTSLVTDVINPPLGLVIGGIDFRGLEIVLRGAQEGVAAITLRYGVFIQTMIEFVIQAFVIFLVIKAINTLRKRLEEPAPTAAAPKLSTQEVLLTEIRDLLKSKPR
jgi:large conductance mechanosensitive channel